ncbi:MAG TPA: GNAT family N-acetyltransferase [Devosiaceae bacterium]|jgi:GNAT superfamily N-acetyltransferase
MPDLLVRLYDLPMVESETRVAQAGIVIRRALAPEGELIREWIGEKFNHHWVAEAAVALSRSPVSLYVAVRDNTLLGFACYDSTARGFFGPTGVDEAQRGQGIGEALLLATLRSMYENGYGYGVIGSPGPIAFYKRRLDAMEIPGSEPGIYKGMLRRG